MESHDGVYFVANENDDVGNLSRLSEKVLSYFNMGVKGMHFGSWTGLFDFIGKQASSGKRLFIALDECQYLSEANHSFDSYLQSAIDAWKRNGSNILLVISGSAK